MDAARPFRLSSAMTVSQQSLVTLAKAAKRIKEIQDAERLEDSFYEFCKAAWQWVDPAEFVDNWHLQDICDHMEAVARGHISRLLLNEPPRTGKTFIISICFLRLGLGAAYQGGTARAAGLVLLCVLRRKTVAGALGQMHPADPVPLVSGALGHPVPADQGNPGTF